MEIKTVYGMRKLSVRHLQRDRMLRKVRAQAVKWTTEGTRKEAFALSIL